MQFLKKTYENNEWKYFIFCLSQRRSILPIISLYFLTLPNAQAHQIGIYSAVWFFASFLLEIPSWYFSDIFWYKKTLVFSKIFMIFSTILFIFWKDVWDFSFASIIGAFSIAFDSGTRQAFLYSSLEKIRKEKYYIKTRAKLEANVALVSIFLIIGLPFLTKIDFLMPFKITLLLDIIWFLTTLSFKSTKNYVKKSERKSIFKIYNNAKKLWFIPFAIFTWAIGGFILSEPVYRSVYLQSLGYPIILIGFVMGLSRFVRFAFGNFAYKLEEIFTMKQLFFWEIFVFSLFFILVAYFSNPYLVGIIFSLWNGYMWARNTIIEDYIIKYYNHNPEYKATLLSIKNQISLTIQTIITFWVGFIMSFSYKLGYLAMGISLACILSISYIFIEHKEKVEK